MSTKEIHITNWETWEKLCAEYKADPYENVSLHRDLGGGNSMGYEFCGDIPEKEE